MRRSPVGVGFDCPLDGDGPAWTEPAVDGVLVGNGLEDQGR